MRMSLQSRREYLRKMQERYRKAKTRAEKSHILDEVVHVLGYHRKHAIQVLAGKTTILNSTTRKRHRPIMYQEALPVIQLVWQTLDYPCAERLHPVLLKTAEHLAAHGVITLSEQVRQQLAQISRATLARRIAQWRSPKPQRKAVSSSRSISKLRSEIPVAVYDWDESKPGALEIDLVEHNGGSTLGHYAYTLNVVDIVSGYSRRRAFLGRSQAVVFQALTLILSEWPVTPWGLHSDNGSEFFNGLLLRFCRQHGFELTRSRPYRKNDNAHVEQKNRQFVREVVGYERYDTPEAVEWLNEVYACLDPYANFFLPMRKVIAKERHGVKVRKTFDQAKVPFDRLVEAGVLASETRERLEKERQALNPLDLHQRLEILLAQGPSSFTTKQEIEERDLVFV